MSYYRQPPLHELVSLLWAPSVCLSARDGQIRAEEVDGLYRGDVRLLSCLLVAVDGALVEPVGQRLFGASEAVFMSRVRLAGDDAADASLLLRRRRAVGPHELVERMEFENFGADPVRVAVTVRCAADLAPVHVVRGGTEPGTLRPTLRTEGTSWSAYGHTVRLVADPSPTESWTESDVAVLRFVLHLTPRQPAGVTVRVTADDSVRGEAERAFLPLSVDEPPVLAVGSEPLAQPSDPRRRKLLESSFQDLERMILADPLDRDDLFIAAGSPWYFTLFGRDALWSALLLLPTGRRIASGTLRVLRRRQGRREAAVAEEEPGKILHEVRRETLRIGAMVIPPLYYGSVDATALWIRLLHEAWRAGMAEATVTALLPGLEAALNWMTVYGDADGDGLVEYRPSTRGGLTNQGWKDTPGSVRWADGAAAQAPLALCEVQGYAYAAASLGADLLDAFGKPGAERSRGWAADLKDRFRESFWITDESGTYPAIALDADKRPVDGAASNMAHLLGTGLLTAAESTLVAARLAQHDLDCGYGLRTLSSASKAFNPLSYHCGSVWPHDTAIAVLGLAADGHHTLARSLAEGLVAVAEHFDYRLPELYAGTSAHEAEPVVAYPTACRPQAWAAAGAVAAIGYLEGRTNLYVRADGQARTRPAIRKLPSNQPRPTHARRET